MRWIVWICERSKSDPRLYSPPRRGVKCGKCSYINPIIAKYCMNCGSYLNNPIREKYDKLITEIYEDVRKSNPDTDYVELDDI